MICCRRLLGDCRSHLSVPYFVQTAGLKNFKPPPNFDQSIRRLFDNAGNSTKTVR
ncbi:hypothetical protein C0J52_04304 [Blattella germanica]|nr:hypothetical protein C0J52_04304 [Blattella germanica]